MVKNLVEIIHILIMILQMKQTYMQVNQYLFKVYGKMYQVASYQLMGISYSNICV